MKNALKYVALAALLAVSARPSFGAQLAAKPGDESPLIDVLVEEGVLTQEEGDRTKQKLAQQYEKTSAGKLQLGSFISKLQLYGDARLRYEWNNAKSNTSPSTNNDRDRYRYRLRLGAVYTYDANWSAGVRLETGTTENSANADYGRYFDKYGDGVNVGLLYLEYKNKFSLFDGTHTVADGKSYQTIADPGIEVGVDVVAGKGRPQILLSSAWFYDEINPEGLAEEISFNHVGLDGLSLIARGAEYLTSVPDQRSAATTVGGSDEVGLLYIAQLEAKYAWSPSGNVRIAPLFLTETTSTLNNQEASSAQSTGVAAASIASNIDSSHPYSFLGRLAVVAVPGEVNWRLWNLPNKVFGTYGVNLEGGDRYHALGFTGSGHNTFWNAGYQIGENKVKGNWSGSVEWRWLETAAYTTNLSDNNWASNDVNQQGFVLRGGYNFTDFLLGQVSYYHSNPIDSAHNIQSAAAYAGYSSASQQPYANQIDTLQVDLSWKF